MNIEFVQNLEQKAEKFLASFETGTINTCKVALAITQVVEKDLTSPAATLIESLIPSGAAYAAEIETLISGYQKMLQIVANVDPNKEAPFFNNLLLGLGAEIVKVIEGKMTISEAIKAFQGNNF